ncbi:TetR/AcrR family transcriptional regulator [Limimaricola litoreus]|uniref:TetR/AcrR family transcriptional regulator n=1 Tax=Limimaricola litoreus TaxID=2955316 RepID=A0A9X2FU70_9RHOB|nr:TetR/AcrR family transcriptional regulator [Limimaricola litoreus]MCP1168531.1 TetR/AcrR family transcriptional regulator [Limimaricola litoreus]
MTRSRTYDRDTALDAALTLFWEKGYHATSLKDLEAALRMRPGSIYAAFKSKEELYLAALDRYFERNRAQLAQIGVAEGSRLDALASFLRGFACKDASDATPRACMLVRTMLDVTDAEPRIGARARAHLDAMTAEIEAIFAAARAAGELPPGADPARLARRYQADMTALRIEAHRGGPSAPLAALAEDMAGQLQALRVA